MTDSSHTPNASIDSRTTQESTNESVNMGVDTGANTNTCTNVESQLFRLRVRFAQTGRCAMLSHLETARYLERVVRRAALPYAITQGFSPHMRISFGSALPVGVGGTCEIFDVILSQRVDEDIALAKMQQASVPDMAILSCSYIGLRESAASVAYPLSTYRVWASAPIKSVAIPRSITVMRKRRERILDPADFLVGGLTVNGNTLEFTLESHESGSLRVDIFTNTLAQQESWRPLQIMRIGLAARSQKCEQVDDGFTAQPEGDNGDGR